MTGMRAERRLAAVLLVSGIAAMLASGQASAQPATMPNGVASGDVTQTTIVLWGRSTRVGTLRFEVARDAAFHTIIRTVDVQVVETAAGVRTLITGLQPGTQYYYRATDAAGATAQGQFSTAQAPGAKHGLRFGVSGDWRNDLQPDVACKNGDERGLDFFVALGDTIYGDVPSPDLPRSAETLAEYRIKYNESYSERYGLNTLVDLREAMPWFTMLDDHEIIDNWAGGAAPATDSRFDQHGQYINETNRYRDAMRAFGEFHPMADERYGATGDPRTAGKLKFYRARQFGDDAALFVLDARSFRDEEIDVPEDPMQFFDYMDDLFTPGRTMLGAAQVADLKADLLAAEAAGVVWKFVMVPEPIMNLGPFEAGDRFEGYAAERTDLLSFIKANEIANVCFVSADIHCTLANNLRYRNSAFGSEIPLKAFEVVTGPVCYEPTFGESFAEYALAGGLITQFEYDTYQLLPRSQKDNFIEGVLDTELTLFGYEPLDLDGNFAARTNLLAGDFVSMHTYSWTEFDINRITQTLTVATYAIDTYTQQELDRNPNRVTGRTPQIVSQFTVKPEGAAVPELALASPDPGTAGMVNAFRVTGATPGEQVSFLYSRDTGRTDVPFCPGLTLGLRNAVVGGAALADGSGTAQLSVFVPSAFAGQRFELQALEGASCRKSNRVEERF